MGFDSLIRAGILAGSLLANHEMGHQQMADNKNVPLTWKGLNFTFPQTDRKTAAEIEGAGFTRQEELGNALNDNTYDLISGLHKANYIASDKGEGDLSYLQKHSGNKYTKHLLGVSALWDLLKGANVIKNKNIDYNFDVIDGAPGGKITYRW